MREPSTLSMGYFALTMRNLKMCISLRFQKLSRVQTQHFPAVRSERAEMKLNDLKICSSELEHLETILAINFYSVEHRIIGESL